MASAKQQENMLLTEHFTWPPISLIDDIINAVNEVLYRCTDTFETGLTSADPALLGFSDRAAAENRKSTKDEDGNEHFPEAKLEIEEGVLKLETLMENAVDKNFDRLEIWTLRNVLCLPKEKDGSDIGEWVRLSGYEDLKIPSKDNTLTPEYLHALRRKLVETTKLNAALVGEKNRNAAQIAKLRSLLQPRPGFKQEPRTSTSPTKAPNQYASQNPPFAFLTHTPAAQELGVQPLPQNGAAAQQSRKTPLTTHTTFTTSQLPYLRQLLASLKPHLATTALPASGGGETGELAKERRVYVESQSKRILERRGVDTKDGVEGNFEDSRMRPEEVRGLENIVAGLGRGNSQGENGEAMDMS